jgi:hypothetical protein
MRPSLLLLVALLCWTQQSRQWATTVALTLHSSSSSSSFVRAASVFQAQQCSFCSTNDGGANSHCTLYMRKQKASDKRTRRLQRGGEGMTVLNTLSSSSITQSPMEKAGLWKVKELSPTITKTAAAPPPPTTTAKVFGAPPAGGSGGRGRSRKRSTLYTSTSFYHDKFLHLLTAEYQAEVCEMWW